MGASIFVGRVGGLAVALGVGMAIAGAGCAVAWADSGESADTVSRSASAGGAPAASVRGNRTAGAAKGEGAAAVATRGQRGPRAGAATVSAAQSPRASAVVAAIEPAEPVAQPPASPPDGVTVDALAPVAVLGSARAAANAEETNNGVTANPTVTIVDGIVQGALNASSASGRTLTYSFTGSSSNGKLDLGTVPVTPSTTDPQSYTILPYANWLDPGGVKGVQQFNVRITETTGFTQFVTSIPLVGLLADPIIGLLQQTPFIGSLLAPLIGGSLLATIDVDVAALAPGDTPVAFTYDVVSFDDTKISTNFFPASGIAAGDTAPTVLNGPGLGNPGVTNPYATTGTEPFVPGVRLVRGADYNVITWDPRGEFASGGVLQLDNPFYEGRDTSAIVSWAAGDPLVELNGSGDPKVGMIGGSYGGGIQLTTASTDPRIDAIVPGIAWNSLVSSLYPLNIFKTAWSLLLTLDLVTTGARINTQIYEGVLTGTFGGFLSDTSEAVLASSGPTSLLNQLQAPTLLIQGTVDALFPLAESVSNAETILANPYGTPVKMAWFCGGHGSCTTGTSPTQYPQLISDTIAWMDTYVAGIGDPAADIPVFQWWDQKADRYTSDLLPFEDGFNQAAPYTATSAGGTLPIIPVIGGSGPNAFAFPTNLIFPTQAGNAINVALTPGVGNQIVGAPQLSFSYSGLGTSKAVYAQFVDNATGQIVGNNVTAVPVTLDGRQRTASVSLNDIAYTVGAGDSLTLQITDWSSIFANAAIGFVEISDVQIDMPLRNQSTVTYTVTPSVTAAGGGTLPVDGWQGLTTAGSPGQYLISGTTPNADGLGGSSGLLYQGPITAQGGAGYVLVMPDQGAETTDSTTTYSADNLGGGQLRVVGTYSNTGVANELGYIYTGTVGDVANPANYVSMPFPTLTATWNVPHSTSGGLVVGNYDSSTVEDKPAGGGRAYIYDAVSQTYLVPSMVYPGSAANTNYGIWWNGGTSYTIAGGYSNNPVNNLLNPRVPLSEAMLVDYDSATGEFSNWTSYRYTNPWTGFSGITHFEGISSVEPGRYTMAATALDEGVTVAGFVTVERNPDGSFGEFRWTTMDPTSVSGGTPFADSVYGNAVVGIDPTAGAVNAYQAVVTPGPV